MEGDVALLRYFAPEKSGSPPLLCSHFHSLCLGCCSHCSPSPIATFPNDKQHFPPCDSPSMNHTCHLYVESGTEVNIISPVTIAFPYGPTPTSSKQEKWV